MLANAEILAVRCDGTDERVKATMRGIRRSIGTAPRKKTPATAERIVAMALADAIEPCYCSALQAPSAAPSSWR
jgi:hypothetical protein